MDLSINPVPKDEPGFINPQAEARLINDAADSSTAFLDALAGRKPAPADLKWGVSPNMKAWRPSEVPLPYRLKQMAEIQRRANARALADSLWVSRDPCPKCGVRADIGCKHKRAA